MRHEDSMQPPVIEGHFSPAQEQRAWRRLVPVALFLVILASAGLLARSPLALAAIAAAFFAIPLFLRLSGRRRLVKVLLSGSNLAVRGGGYDIQLQAPFRLKTGVERRPATARQDETCFVRMVIDVQGKPLVLEERVPAGYLPPPLDEIIGASSALGVADLTSLTPFPGTLWALIEQMEKLSRIGPQAEQSGQTGSLFRIGKAQAAGGRYIDAISTYSAIIRQSPDAALAYYSRGSARYYAREELDKAVNDLTTALRLDPNQYKAYRMRGLVRAQLGDWAGAREDCSAALQFQPSSAELYNLRGTACYRLEDYAAALANFDRAVSLDGRRGESFYNRGLAKRRLGKLEEALEDFQRALELKPAFVEARQNIDALRGQLAQKQASSKPQAKPAADPPSRRAQR